MEDLGVCRPLSGNARCGPGLGFERARRCSAGAAPDARCGPRSRPARYPRAATRPTPPRGHCAPSGALVGPSCTSQPRPRWPAGTVSRLAPPAWSRDRGREGAEDPQRPKITVIPDEHVDFPPGHRLVEQPAAREPDHLGRARCVSAARRSLGENLAGGSALIFGRVITQGSQGRLARQGRSYRPGPVRSAFPRKRA